MAISFPSSPTIGDQVVVDSKTYTWDGTVWEVSASVLSGSINDLSDVSVSGAVTNDVLQFDGAQWVPGTVSAVGSVTFDDLTDVNTTGVVKDDIIQYDGTNWVKKTDYSPYRSSQLLYSFTDASFPKVGSYAGTNRNVATEAELTTAMTNSVTNDTITLTADINVTATVNVNKSVRIVGNGFKIFTTTSQSTPTTLINVTANNVTFDSTLIIEHNTNTGTRFAVIVNALNFVSAADVRFLTVGYLLSGSFSISGKTTNLFSTNTLHQHFYIYKLTAASQINGVIFNNTLAASTNSRFIYIAAQTGVPSDGWYDLLYVANNTAASTSISLITFITFIASLLDTVSNKKVLIVDNNTWRSNFNNISIQLGAGVAILNSFRGISITNNTVTTTATTNYLGILALNLSGSGAAIDPGNTDFIYYNNTHPTTNTLTTNYLSALDSGGVVYSNLRFTAPVITPLTEKQIFDNSMQYSKSNSLDYLSDVDLTTVAPGTGQSLQWNGTTSWVPYSVPLPFRNLIINGDFTINQRKNLSTSLTDFTVAATNTFLADRFFIYQSSNLANLRYMQGFGSFGLPTGLQGIGINDYTSFTTYGVGGSPAAADLQYFSHRIEGQTMRNLLWGTANAKSATLSFWVRTAESGGGQKFGLTIKNTINTAVAYVTTYTVPTANQWNRISITIPGPTTGVWYGEGLACQIYWNFATGSNWRATAGSTNTWTTTGGENYYAASDAYNYSSVSGRNFSIYGIQFEEGTVASAFETVPTDITLSRCQRYYYNYEGLVAEQYIGDGYVRNTTTQAVLILRHPVPMMQSPSCNIIGTLSAGDLAAFNTSATINSQTNNKTNSRLVMTLASAGTAFRPITFYLQSLLNNQFEVRAET